MFAISRRLLLSAAAGAAGAAIPSAVLLAACGSGGASRPAASGGAATGPALGPAKLAWWSRGTQEWNEMLLEVARTYMQQNPQITIEYAFQPSDGYTDRIITAAASETLPDVFHLNSQDTISLASKGLLQDVSTLLAKDAKVKKSDFFPWAWLRAEYRGKTYAMPLKGTCNVIWVNQNLFEREGLALPKTGWTWAQFVETARKLAKTPTDPSGVWGAWTYPWQTAVWQNGGDLVDKDGKKALIAEAPAADAIQWVADLALKEHVAPKPDEGQDVRSLAVPFSSGRIAMYPGGEPDFGNLLKITDFKWAAAPLPLAASGKPQASFGAATLFGLSPKTKVQPQAWAFLGWLCTSKDAQAILNKAGKLGVPPYKPIYDSLFVNQPPREDVKKVLGEMALANHPYLETLTTVPQVEKLFSTELAPVWLGQVTARDATKKIAEQLGPLLAQ